MDKENFIRLILAHERIKYTSDALAALAGDSDGIVAEALEDIEQVISTFSKWEYNHVLQEKEGLCGDYSYDQAKEVLTDSTLTPEEKCKILFNNTEDK